MSDPTQPHGASRVLGGRYRLGDTLGRGGMAVVWRATDEVLGREVAVKTLDLTGPDSETAAARFQREARATAALNHPNIVTVYDTGVEGDTAYLVMELLPGPTLAEELRERGPMPVGEVRRIAEQMCDALAAAHAAGIVHRDIKPGNIARTAGGSIKVLDFGIIQILDEALGGHQQLTMTNTVMGTAAYLAPEQAQGGRVDERADLYALGCVLMTLLTGEPPFDGGTPVATLLMHTQEPPPDVRDRRPEVPAALALLVGDLLAKSPASRPASAAAVGERLRRLDTAAAATTQVLPTAGPPPPPPPSTAPQPVMPPPPMSPSPQEEERRRSWAWVWLLLALLLATGGLWLLLSGDGASEGPTTPSSTPVAPTTVASTPASTSSSTEPGPSSSTSEEPTSSTSEPSRATSSSSQPPTSAPSTDAPTSEQPSEAVQSAAESLDETVKDVLDKDAREPLKEPLKALEKAVEDGTTGEVARALADVATAYGQAVNDGLITGDAVDTIGQRIQSVQDALDA